MSLRLWAGEYVSGVGAAAAGMPLDWLEAGVQMRDALLEDLSRGTAVDAWPGVTLSYPHGQGVPAAGVLAQECQPQTGESAFDFLCREGATHELVWLVAPEVGGLLERLARAVGPRRWIGCTPEAIALASSKRATLSRLAEWGLCTPLAFEGQASAWVVKPDDGAGSNDCRRYANRQLAEADRAGRRARGESATLEPWVDGEALSLSLLCREGAAPELLSINRQGIEVDAWGQLHDGGVVIAQVALDDPRAQALRAVAVGVGRAVPGLRGYVGVDLVWHRTRGPVVIEVNPRLTCAYVGLSRALGRNLAAEIVIAHLEATHATA